MDGWDVAETYRVCGELSGQIWGVPRCWTRSAEPATQNLWGASGATNCHLATSATDGALDVSQRVPGEECVVAQPV